MSEADMAMVDTLPRSTFSRFTPFGRRNSETGSVGNSPTLTAPYSDSIVTPRFTLESLAAELELMSTSPTGGFNYLSGDLYNTQPSRAPLTKSRSVPNVLREDYTRTTALIPLRKAKSVRFADSQGLPLIKAVYELSKQDSSYTANKIVPYSDDLSAGVRLATGGQKYAKRLTTSSESPDKSPPTSSTKLSELTINTTRNTILKCQTPPILKRLNSPPSPPTHRHRLEFTQPSLEPDFFHRVNKQCVVLDNIREESRSLQGTVRVANLSYDKDIVIRWTHDNWRSSHDTKAVFCANDGATDRFTFELPINGDDVIFCIQYKTGGQEFWDNNRGKNYTVFSE